MSRITGLGYFTILTILTSFALGLCLYLFGLLIDDKNFGYFVIGFIIGLVICILLLIKTLNNQNRDEDEHWIDI